MLAVIYEPGVPPIEGKVKVVSEQRAEDLQDYWDCETDPKKPSRVHLCETRLDAENFVADLGTRPGFELLCRWAAHNAI